MDNTFDILERNIFLSCKKELKTFKNKLNKSNTTYVDFAEKLHMKYYENPMNRNELIESYDDLISSLLIRTGIFIELSYYKNYNKAGWHLSGVIFTG